MPEAIGLIGLGEIGAEGALGAEALFGAEAATGAAELGTGALIGAEEGAALGAAELGPGIGFGAEGIDLTGLGAESFVGPGVEVGDITGVGSAQFGSGFLPGGSAIAQGPIVGAEGFAAPTSLLGDPLAPSVGGPLSPVTGALDTSSIVGNESSLALSPGTTPTNVPGTVLQGASLDPGQVSPFSFGQGFGAVENVPLPGVNFTGGPDFVPMPGEDFLTSSGPMSSFDITSTGQIADPSGVGTDVRLDFVGSDPSQQIPDFNSEILQQETLKEAFGPQEQSFANPPGNELGPNIGETQSTITSLSPTGESTFGSPRMVSSISDFPGGPDITGDVAPGVPDSGTGVPPLSDILGDAPSPTPPIMGVGLEGVGVDPGLAMSPEQTLGADSVRMLMTGDTGGGGDLTFTGMETPADATSATHIQDMAAASGDTTGGGTGGDFNLTKASSGAFGVSPLQGLGLLGLGGSLLMGNRGSPFGNTLGDVGSFQVQQARDVLNTALQGKLNPSQIDAFNQAFAQGKARVDQQFRAMGRDPAADSSYIGALDNLHQQLMAQFIQQATTQALQEMSVADAALANAARFQIAQDESFRRALQGAATALARMGGGGGSTST